jgi:isopenicillin-N epimerase
MMTPDPLAKPLVPPLQDDLRAQWMLAEGVTFLNHGSYGALPRSVFDEQERWRRRIEAEPIELLGRRQPELIEAAKAPLGELLHMRAERFGLVTNATEGINAVLHSLRLKEGGELLTTNHVYNAVRQAMRHAATRQGASYREIEVATPVGSAAQIAQRVLDQVSDRTRLLVVDHITSPTALIFPAAQIVAGCAKRGVEVLVDGAHAPGMIELDVPSLGAAYYAGNLHKWCCAPKGCAFLWVADGREGDIHPCVVSHNFGQGLAAEFAWQGTRDASAWLTLPAALGFMARLGWERVREHNHRMAAWAHAMLCERWRVPPLSPLDGRLLGAMATIALPGRLAEMSDEESKLLQQSLYTDQGIEVPLIHWQGAWHLRVSCQVFNRAADYERLGEVIETCAKR